MINPDTTRARFAATAERLAELGAARVQATRARVDDLLSFRGDEVALDAACGTGTLALALAPRVLRVIGVDLVPEMLDQGRKQATADDRIEWLVGDVYALPIDGASVHVAGLMRTLHHVERPGDAIAEIARVLVPGGVALIIDQLASEDPDEAALFEQIERRRDPSHARTLADSEIQRLAGDAGLTIERLDVATEDRRLDLFLELAGCDAATSGEIHELARIACAAGKSAGVDLRPANGGYEFTERVGWYVGRAASRSAT